MGGTLPRLSAFGPMAIVLATGVMVLVCFTAAFQLAFAALLLALLLREGARKLQQHTQLAPSASLALTVFAAGLAAGGLVLLTGAAAGRQLAELVEQLPVAWTPWEAALSGSGPGAWLLAQVEGGAPGGDLERRLASAMVLTAALAAGLTVGAGTLRSAALRLAPGRQPRAIMAKGLTTARIALTAWLQRQAIAMLVVTTVFGLGLWALGMTSPMVLGALAGVARLAPYVGAPIALLPALILATPMGAPTMGAVLALYVGARLLEGRLLASAPLRREPRLPPGLGPAAAVTAGILMGLPAALLATPAALAAFAMTRVMIFDPPPSMDGPEPRSDPGGG